MATHPWVFSGLCHSPHVLACLFQVNASMGPHGTASSAYVPTGTTASTVRWPSAKMVAPGPAAFANAPKISKALSASSPRTSSRSKTVRSHPKLCYTTPGLPWGPTSPGPSLRSPQKDQPGNGATKEGPTNGTGAGVGTPGSVAYWSPSAWRSGGECDSGDEDKGRQQGFHRRTQR